MNMILCYTLWTLKSYGVWLFCSCRFLHTHQLARLEATCPEAPSSLPRVRLLRPSPVCPEVTCPRPPPISKPLASRQTPTPTPSTSGSPCLEAGPYHLSALRLFASRKVLTSLFAEVVWCRLLIPVPSPRGYLLLKYFCNSLYIP